MWTAVVKRSASCVIFVWGWAQVQIHSYENLLFWFFLLYFWMLSDVPRTLLLHRQSSKEWWARLPFFIWSFTNCNKRAPRQCSGHCIWSYLKNTLVNKWLHQPPQIRSNKTGYIYSAAELRAICGSLLTEFLHADPNALEMGIVFSLGIPQCFPPPRFLQWKGKRDSVVSEED